MHDFDEGGASSRRQGKDGVLRKMRAVGYFHSLPQAEQMAVVRAGMEMRANARVEARRDIAEQQAYSQHKREQVSQKQIDKLVAEYTKALAAFVKYSSACCAAPTLAAARAQLAENYTAAKKHD
eukprot:993923-Pleurochrysis_carterae.AAC.1